jgi:hypothetical protein
MFRSFSGFRTQYDGLTLLVVSEFDEWKVLGYGPGVTIHGARQFSEAKAKEHAVLIAQTYLRDLRGEVADPGEVRWEPTSDRDWLSWR